MSYQDDMALQSLWDAETEYWWQIKNGAHRKIDPDIREIEEEEEYG